MGSYKYEGVLLMTVEILLRYCTKSKVFTINLARNDYM